MAPKTKKPPTPEQEEEASLEEQEEEASLEEEEEDSGEDELERNALGKKPSMPSQDNDDSEEEAASEETDAPAASPPRKRSGEVVAASPKPKKTKGAPPPSPKRPKKPSPSNEKDGSDEGETDAPAASPLRKRSRVVAASPKPKKTRDAPKRGKKPPSPSQEEDGSDEEEAAVEETDAPAASPPGKPSAEVVVAPQHKKKTQPSHGKDGSGEEVEEEGVEDSGDAQPVRNAQAGKTAASSPRKRSKPSGVNAASHQRKKRGKPVAKSGHNDEVLDQETECSQEEQAVGDGFDKSLPERNASLGKLRSSKPAVERSWSREDELMILTALAKHAQTHGGALLQASDLSANLDAPFDKRDADADKLANKVRKLRRWHSRVRPQGCPTDGHGRQLFELCQIVWGNGAAQPSSHGASMVLPRSHPKTNYNGHVVPEEAHQDGSSGEHTKVPVAVEIGAYKNTSAPVAKDGHANFGEWEDNGGRVDGDKQVKATFVRREFNELIRLYPDLAKEVQAYADTRSSGSLIMAAFEIIGDDEARDLDARCKKQRIDTFNLEMSQAELTKAVLCVLASRIN